MSDEGPFTFEAIRDAAVAVAEEAGAWDLASIQRAKTVRKVLEALYWEGDRNGAREALIDS